MISIDELLRQVVRQLEREKCQYALAGGYAAALYRTDMRTTNDLDFLLQNDRGADDVAKKIIEGLGMTAGLARLSDLRRGPGMNKKTEPKAMMVGRTKDDPHAPGLDFILPGMPWFKTALDRAQHQKVDFGYVEVPVVTAEDFILSKLQALLFDPSRFKDLDDLKAVFQSTTQLDLDYLAAQMETLGLPLPKLVWEFAPKALQVASKHLLAKKP